MIRQPYLPLVVLSMSVLLQASVESASFSAKGAPADATLVKVSASTVQAGHPAYLAIDGDMSTRWCAENAIKPQWLQLEFETPRDINEVAITWELPTGTYGYKLEGSMNGTSWALIVDASANTSPGATINTFPATKLRFLRVQGVSTTHGWISLRELTVKGDGIQSLFPVLERKAAATLKAATSYKDGGNITPEIVTLTPEEEGELLKDVTVPEGFEATLFAPWQSANYPVYVAASPAGDLYVSSDGNGSLGRLPNRGRVLRLRDTNNDGRADEVTEFVKSLDSPRGIIWDHDRLYVLHPPHITVYFDRDGDGVAEESKRLISNIAFGFKDRPADHTTNGLELGPDGWLYIAGGDFGFMEATGTDGRTLQHRGGGVIRFRPDGSGLEIFSTGTRNILSTPMSPLLEMFARDNTNDGGGWDVRFHYLSGLDDHGYPRLYMNFPDEIIQPLADYGGGSGCGGVYIHEPGFPDAWANAPFTCDWGKRSLFRHNVKRQGAGFIETEAPKAFITLSRPTDADVDGMSRVYQASWKGPATFDWKSPEHGYITRVTPKGYTPEPLPDFEKRSDAELIQLLESPSQVRALAAQRTLLRREENKQSTQLLYALAADTSKERRSRVLALYAVTQRGVDSKKSRGVIETIKPLAKDPTIQAFVIRALGDMGIDRITAGEPGLTPADMFVAGALSDDPRTRIESMVAAVRQKKVAVGNAIARSLGDKDPVIAHTAFRALAMLGTPDPALAILDDDASSDDQRFGASRALMRMHESRVVDSLLQRLDTASRASQPYVFAALCRLYHKDAEWEGDSWATRPDTRGPYYKPVIWERSADIREALKSTLAHADAVDAATHIETMTRNRIKDDDALDLIIKMALEDPAHIPTVIAQVVELSDIPARVVPLLHKSAADTNMPPQVLTGTIACLLKVRNEDVVESVFSAMSLLDQSVGGRFHLNPAKDTFYKGRGLDNAIHKLVEFAAGDTKVKKTLWAHVALLELAARKNAGAEVQAIAQKEIDRAWQDTDRKTMLIMLARVFKNHYLDARITVALTDPSPKVANEAKIAVRQLRIQPTGADKTPKIGDLKVDDALAQVKAMKGDAALGEAVFMKAACVTCHTVSQDQPLKGPYLGNISGIYNRDELAIAILDPNRTIAQGFASHILTMNDKTALMGFITKETADVVQLRDMASKEHTVKKSDIAERSTIPTSMMPPALMNAFSVKEFASLLDYIESLSKP